MRAVVLHFLLSTLTAALGVIGGWWLRERRAQRWDLLFAYEKQLAQQTVALVDRLLTDVKKECLEHSARLDKASADLKQLDPASADCRERTHAACHDLLSANRRMVDRLALAEERLADQATQIDWWLKATGSQPPPNGGSDRDSKPVERLRDLSASLSSDIGQHHHQVDRLAREIDARPSAEGTQVISAITEIMEATARMQQRIAAAEETLKEQAAKLELQAAIARTDSLTELGNRRAFDEELTRRLADVLRNGGAMSVVLIDVDHFKRLNDRHGHQAGDTVLRGLAGTLRAIVREGDIVTRYGGEEFALLLPETVLEQAIPVAERARTEAAAAGFPFAGTDHHITVSTGIAEARADEHADDIVRRADEALYRAKQAGRNRSYFHDGRTSRPVNAAAEADRNGSESLDDPTAPGLTASPTRPAPTTARRPRVISGPKLANRTIFFAAVSRRLAEWKRGGTVFAVVLARVDNRSQLVEQYGEDAGEIIVSTVAQLLEALAREMDERCLYDDDSFGLLLPGTDRETASEIAERLRQGIEGCRVRYGVVDIRFSATVAAADARSGDSAADILRAAELALDPNAAPPSVNRS